MKAWLVTWEWIGDHVSVSNPIVSILNPRLGPGTVKQHIERLYIDQRGTLRDRVEAAKGRRHHPYPAEYFLTPSGVRFERRITCGHNPRLYARMVEDLEVLKDSKGEETLNWKELDLPHIQS